MATRINLTETDGGLTIAFDDVTITVQPKAAPKAEARKDRGKKRRTPSTRAPRTGAAARARAHLAEIRDLYDRGFTQAEIGARFDIPQSMVSAAMRKAGIPARSLSEAQRLVWQSGRRRG